MTNPPADSPDATLARLARDNPQHLRWLHRQVSDAFVPEDLADILQDAHVDATVALHSSNPPAFSDWSRAVAWFRRICFTTAIDVMRRRDGRRPSERAARPKLVSLEGLLEDPNRPEAALAIADEALETMGVDTGAHEVRLAIREAVRRLPDADVRILCWRYRENLEPEEIQRLEGLTDRQYERRHTSAVKALGRALARLELHLACRQTRGLLRRRPQALLDASAGAARIHVEDCPACRAFRLHIRGGLAAIPLSPAAIGAKLLLAQAPSAPTASASAAATPHTAGAWHVLLPHTKAVAAVAAGTLAIGATSVAVTVRDAEPAPPSLSERRGLASLDGSHGTIVAESPGEHIAHDPLLRR
jgi:RNA polymerase sigma factor (sigma-70 family)